MEREGKAAGGRVAAAHLELCCVWSVLREGRKHGVSVNSLLFSGIEDLERFRTIYLERAKI